MKVLLLGATGMIGRAAALRLRRDGHQLSAWVRSPSKAMGLLGAEVELLDARGGEAALREAVSRLDAVVNASRLAMAGGSGRVAPPGDAR